jgi:hypothetical protein
MRRRRPTRSMSAIARRLARKYSVPLHAAMMRDLVSSMPRRSKSSVCAGCQYGACYTDAARRTA